MCDTAKIEIVIPPEVYELAVQSVGRFFEPICKTPAEVIVRDFLDLSKAAKRADVLKRYAPLENRKLLEIGSGFGTNLAVWIKNYNIDGYGVEPASPGVDQGFVASRKLFSANGIDAGRICNAKGESPPFPDGTFDIAYSANILEHTEYRDRVLNEAARVLRCGGILHMEMPNYLPYFEGHYMVAQPPIFWKLILVWWLRLVCRRDSSFAKTIQTQINPLWCRRAIKKVGRIYPLKLIPLGQDVFLERLSHAFTFETDVVGARLGSLIGRLQRFDRQN